MNGSQQSGMKATVYWSKALLECKLEFGADAGARDSTQELAVEQEASRLFQNSGGSLLCAINLMQPDLPSLYFCRLMSSS